MVSLVQIPLQIQLFHEATFDNFVVGSNELLLTALQAPATEHQWCIYLWGRAGIGKTHLLQATCHLAAKNNQRFVYVPLKELRHYSAVMLENLHDLEDVALIALDDIDLVTQDATWAEALFHLYNHCMNRGHRLIISALQAPQYLTCVLADLQSRLSSATIFQVQLLTDEAKKLALLQRAAEKGLLLSDEVGEYLVRHYSRELNDLFASLEQLDRASLIAKRRLTIPFVKEILSLS